MKIGLINGPNLNLLGKREPDIYGNFTLKDIEKTLNSIIKEKYADIEILSFQSNVEGELINFIHDLQPKEVSYAIINPAGYTTTSIALRDAILAVDTKFIEVHISNIYKREKFRQKSMLSAACIGQVSGFGIYSYEMALYYILNNL